MPGSLTQAAAPWPKPLEIAGRALLATVLVLFVVQAFGRPLVRPLLPIFRTAVPLLDGRFVITDLRLARVGADEVVRFRGNLSRPLVIHDRIVSPFGWNGMPAGGFQTTYTVGGVLQYSAILLIFALAWPAGGLRELACRLGFAAGCMVLLPMATVPLTAVAEFRNGLESLVSPGAHAGSMIASRYLMGGGGWAIALVAAAFCIGSAHRLRNRGGMPPHETGGTLHTFVASTDRSQSS